MNRGKRNYLKSWQIDQQREELKKIVKELEADTKKLEEEIKANRVEQIIIDCQSGQIKTFKKDIATGEFKLTDIWSHGDLAYYEAKKAKYGLKEGLNIKTIKHGGVEKL